MQQIESQSEIIPQPEIPDSDFIPYHAVEHMAVYTEGAQPVALEESVNDRLQNRSLEDPDNLVPAAFANALGFLVNGRRFKGLSTTIDTEIELIKRGTSLARQRAQAKSWDLPLKMPSKIKNFIKRLPENTDPETIKELYRPFIDPLPYEVLRA